MVKGKDADNNELLEFIEFSRVDDNTIYKLNIPYGFEIIRQIDNYMS